MLPEKRTAIALGGGNKIGLILKPRTNPSQRIKIENPNNAGTSKFINLFASIFAS